MVLSSVIFYIVFSSSRCVGDHRYDSLNKTSKGKDGKERKIVRGEERKKRKGDGEEQRNSIVLRRRILEK